THAYISESNGRRIIRFRIEHDGTLADRESVGPDPLGETAFPDGFALDAEGNVWATIVTQNSLVIITPHGDIHTVFADPNPKAAPALLEAYGSGVMPVRLLGATAGPTIQLPTSVAFGGPDLQTVYMGSLAMPYLLSFRSPVPGLPLQHQHPDHPMLKNLLHIGR
ncbi:MAG TPA: SMP-30/gluconolactonase/LRE family protein, partial [Ktedonobacteraceae bacterium]|nr:SMP-30/gluconolactonase/LRE family protein [Ktedonobacteraceae bacterium]